MGGKSLRDIGRPISKQDRPFHGDHTPPAPDIEPVGNTVKVRVRADVQVIDQDWVQVSTSVKLLGTWIRLSGTPVLLARRFSGEREAQELYPITVLRMVIQRGGAVVRSLGQPELRMVVEGVTRYDYWATVGGRFSVAVLRPDNVATFVNVP